MIPTNNGPSKGMTRSTDRTSNFPIAMVLLPVRRLSRLDARRRRASAAMARRRKSSRRTAVVQAGPASKEGAHKDGLLHCTVILFVIVAVCTLLSLGVMAGAASPICGRDSRIVPGERLGEVTLGMLYKDVVAAWGTPYFQKGTLATFGTNLGLGGNPGDVRVWLRYPGADRVDRITISLPTSVAHCKTAEGVHVGSTIDDVRERLGPPSGSYAISRPNGTLTILAYDTQRFPGVLFMATDTTVTRIVVFWHGACGDFLTNGCLNIAQF